MFWQLGIFLNTVKRILEVLHPGVEDFLKCWAACLTIEDGNTIFGEQMNGITVTLRKKYKKYMQAIVEKLVSNVSVTLNIPSFHLPLYSLGVCELYINKSWCDILQAQANRTTRLKRILEETKEAEGEPEIRDRMQTLCLQLTDSIHNLHHVLAIRIFVAICRGFWDRMGQVCGRKQIHYKQEMEPSFQLITCVSSDCVELS